MVIVGRSNASRRRLPTRRRAGQANGNGMQQAGDDSLLPEFQSEVDTFQELPEDNDRVQVLLGQDTDAEGNIEDVVLVRQEGVADDDRAEVLARLPARRQQVEPVEEVQCEFPAQSIVMEREIQITNSAPRIVGSDVDECGNLRSFREQVTRTMTAGGWVPASGANGPLANLTLEDNGEAYISRFGPGADIANSRSRADIDFPATVSQGSFGGRYPQNGSNGNGQMAGRRRAGVSRMNQNAQFGAAHLSRFRHA